jgi:hypothetical protein
MEITAGGYRRQGETRQADIYHGRVNTATKYIDRVVEVVHSLAEEKGDMESSFTFYDVFDVFLEDQLAQRIMNDEYDGSVRRFRRVVRSSMYQTVRLLVHKTEEGMRYAVNMECWQDQHMLAEVS